MEEAAAAKAELASRNSSEMSILPDLDCDVDFGENPQNVPTPSPGICIKAESLEDELEKRQTKVGAKTNGKQVLTLTAIIQARIAQFSYGKLVTYMLSL